MARHEDVLIALRQIIRATDLYSRKLSKVSGLTSPQLLIMQAIAAHGEMTMGDLANEVSLSQATSPPFSTVWKSGNYWAASAASRINAAFMPT